MLEVDEDDKDDGARTGHELPAGISVPRSENSTHPCVRFVESRDFAKETKQERRYASG